MLPSSPQISPLSLTDKIEMTQHEVPQFPAPDSQVYLYPYPSFPDVLKDGCFEASITTVLLKLPHFHPEICSINDSFILFLPLFPPSGFFSLSLYHVQVSSNLRNNKTPTILHASSIYHSMFFLFLSRLLGSSAFSFATFCCPSNPPTNMI